MLKLANTGFAIIGFVQAMALPSPTTATGLRSSQEYEGHFVCTVDTSEKGLPPPPGLDRFAARSLQRPEEDVQRLEIQPLIHRVAEHVI